MRHSNHTHMRPSARVLRAGQSETAHLQAISLGGITLSGIRTLTPGETVEVLVADAVFCVEVVWTHGMTSGTRFLPETDPAEVLRIRAQTQQQKSSDQSVHQASDPE